LLGQEKGVAIAPLAKILERLGEVDVPVDEIETRLSAKADELVALRKQLHEPASPEVGEVRARALVLLEQKGDFVGAANLLRSAREDLRARRRDGMLTEALLLSDEAKIDHLALRYRDSAKKYAEAAGLVSFDANATFRYRMAQAGALFKLGDELADNNALSEAIDVYHSAVKTRDRERTPLDWAQAQNDLGCALQALGQRLSDSPMLDAAEQAYRAALEERPARLLLEWAQTQGNLAGLLAMRSKHPGTTNRLPEATEIMKAVLSCLPREERPLHWADMNNKLGSALWERGQLEERPDLLLEALQAHEAALEIFTRERGPLNWALTMHGVANARLVLGEITCNRGLVERAIEDCRAALEGHTRERMPMRWADTQNALGYALSVLSAGDSTTTRLVEAITAFRDALKERTRARTPLQWARTQKSLGDALYALAVRDRIPGPLREAQGAYASALEVVDRNQDPLTWADLQSRFALATWGCGKADEASRGALHSEALRAMQSALDAVRSVLPPDHPIVMTFKQNTLAMQMELTDPRTANQ
jgi:tetratricopeptide (TPR) repeat protein